MIEHPSSILASEEKATSTTKNTSYPDPQKEAVKKTLLWAIDRLPTPTHPPSGKNPQNNTQQ